ncbi:hypothetical protein MUA02_12315 [Enterobacteriaceae bacterium H20N1]|uniref:Uncharacterized protein n=1 Tax=Dryocola boscaweniae TaxID=2925397 RepID=A0A9X2W8V4_9ENTR|nr:hypothetical protein [Dryocola boscaweniae]MCT4702646.1 hypothetical protein [Dryocola boscaweniae]MCT4714977.1 hypothetical protein [Dryocola boscaweniae]MCT4719814.1 hypothetical protein [Dryocola boscaweniae]
MQKLAIITALGLLLVAGCAQQAPKKTVVREPVIAPQPAAPLAQIQPESNSRATRMQECRKELEAMQVYNKASYNKYMYDVQKLTSSINKYRQVEPSISTEINDIVLPQTEFQMRELCFRIKNHLMQLMVKSS